MNPSEWPNYSMDLVFDQESNSVDTTEAQSQESYVFFVEKDWVKKGDFGVPRVKWKKIIVEACKNTSSSSSSCTHFCAVT